MNVYFGIDMYEACTQKIENNLNIIINLKKGKPAQTKNSNLIQLYKHDFCKHNLSSFIFKVNNGILIKFSGSGDIEGWW